MKTEPNPRENFVRIVLEVTRRIPRGKVATYGQVAALAGKPRNSRQIGKIMSQLRPEDTVPWHRVVNAQGRVSQRAEPRGTESLQRKLLESEGVKFSPAGRIRMEIAAWDPPLAGFLGRAANRDKVGPPFAKARIATKTRKKS